MSDYAHIAQSVLYLQPNRTDDNEVINQLQDNWNLNVVQHTDIQEKSMYESLPHVGLLHLEKTDDFHLGHLRNFIDQHPDTQWIALTSEECINSPVVRCLITESCYDYFTLPLHADAIQNLAFTLGHALGMSFLQRRSREDNVCDDYEMVGTSHGMLKLFKALRRVALVDAPVLITGESGTGKELIARAIHERSFRHAKPFIAVNCGALPDALVQSELFGHEKGAFTGAVSQKIGQIEAANQGTLFLDEIGDLPLDQQVNLLRFLQEQNIRRLGATQDTPVDIRVLAATHVDLEHAVKDGYFREDLLYRLNVLQLTPPPLRERHEDIELLARFFFGRFQSEGTKTVRGFSQNALLALQRHNWPGNVRELINRIRRAIVMCEKRMISPADLGLPMPSENPSEYPGQSLKSARESAEKKAVQQAIAQAAGNITRAAKQLQVSRITLYRLLDKYRLN